MLFLEDVLEEYYYHCVEKGFTKKTMINKRQELEQMKNFLIKKRGIKELKSITVHDLKAYRMLKQKSGLKPQSIVSMFKMIRAFFEWCVEEGYLKENIAKKIELPKVPKTVIQIFTDDEVFNMIDAFTYKNYIEARNKAIIAMLADCGLRSMEIRGLKNNSVTDNSILVHGKGNKERVAFISPILKKILIKYERIKKQHFKDKITTDHYFLSYKGSELSHVGLYNVIKLAGKRAGIEDKRVSPHTFRHYYAIQSLASGNVDLYSLSRLLGHSEITTTQRYLESLTNSQLIDKAIASSPLMNLHKNKRR